MQPIIKNARNLVSRNSSDILLAGGVGCILFGGALAIRQTPKAIKLLEEKEEKDKLKKVKKVAPLFVPAVGFTVLGIVQIIWARNITKNKIAAITTAYTVSETAYKTFKDKVKDNIDDEKYEEIKQKVADDKMRNDSINNKEVVVTARGNVLIYDNMSGRYLKSTMEDIDRAANIINKRLRNDMTIQLNEFYCEIGLPIVKMGCEVGWNIDREDLEISYTSSIAENGEPCLVMDYDCVKI